jgi:hypothetical protein
MDDQAPAATRIRFGDGPAQDLPLNLAEYLLRVVWAKSPDRFGAMLTQAMKNLYGDPRNGHR